MKNRLRLIQFWIIALTAFWSFQNNGYAQCNNCIGCFELENLPTILPTDPGQCFATLDITPGEIGSHGSEFPDIMVVPGSSADPNTGLNITITSVTTDVGGALNTISTSPYIIEVDANSTVSISFEIRTNGTDLCAPATINYLISDDEAPAFDMPPADAQFACLSDVPTAGAASVTATDNCSTGANINITFDETMMPGQCSGGNFTRTWTATDEAGNSSVYTQTIIIEADLTAPVLTDIPMNGTFECDAIPAAGLPTVNDNCDAMPDVVFDQTSSTDGLSCPNVEIITRTWTVTDACGNSDVATQTITVTDNSAPTFATGGEPQDAAADCATGTSGAGGQFEAWVMSGGGATVNDNCSSSLIITASIGGIDITADPAAALNAPCPDGTYVVDFVFSDQCNGSVNGSATYTINDVNPPEITVGAADITVECDGLGNPNDLNGWLFNVGLSETADICTTVADTALTVNGVDYDYVTEFATARAAIEAEIATQSATCSGVELARVQVMFTYTDACGNVSSTDADFVVEDNNDPVWDNTPDDLTIECGANNATEIQDWLAANQGGMEFMGASGAASDCGNVTYSNDYSAISDECGATGSSMVTFTATDECGNATTATATITVADTTGPSIDTPASAMTVECDGTGNNADLTAWITTRAGAMASDECGSIVWTFEPNPTNLSDDCGATGSVEVTFTATDECGNSSSTAATFTVEDTTPPTITATATDQTVQCDGGGNTADLAAWLAANGTATANDNCGGVTWTNDYNGSLTASCGATGASTVTFIATDDCGNTAITMATFTIEDTTNPTFTVPADVTVECTDATDISATGDVTDEADICSPNLAEATFSDDVVDGTCPTLQIITRTWTLTDDCGNSTVQTQTITVQDNTAPTLSTMAADMTVECDGAGNAADLTAWLDNNGGATASDPCGDITWSYSPNPATLSDRCGETGVVTVTFTATDDCGNTASTTATFEVTDNISPTIMPTSSDIDEECGGGDDQAALEAWINNLGGAMAMDACSGSDVAWTIVWTDSEGNTNPSHPASDPTATYPTVVANDCDWFVDVTFTVTDPCDNPSTTTSRFSILDTSAPTLAGVPADATVECDAVPMPAMPTASDDCDLMVDIVLVADTIAGVCTHRFSITRTWTATDDCGNSDVASQTITVEDTTAPTFTEPTDVTIECDQDPTDLTLTGDVMNVADNCDMVLDTTFVDDTSGLTGCSSTGTIVRTWTLTDDCGNATALTQNITILDTTNPVLDNVPNDLTISCDINPAAGNPTATDNCDGNPAITLNETDDQAMDNTDCNFYDYTITRVWTATDACGNTDIATQTITVQDDEAPQLSSEPADVTVECGDPLITNPPTITAFDNCDPNVDVILTDAPAAAPACPSGYTIMRTWSATDACGNNYSYTQNILVEDTAAPVFLDCLADITLNTSDDEANDGLVHDCDVSYEFLAPIVTDACAANISPCTPVFLDPTTPNFMGGFVTITGTPDPNVLVNPVTLWFSVPNPPNTASGAVTLNLDFVNIDGEFTSGVNTEFFFIIGEDGTVLGQTVPATSQCSNPPTTTVTIPQAMFNQWALDGRIEIVLDPFDPGTGNQDQGINNICGGNSQVTGSLVYDCSTPPDDFTLVYSLDGGTTTQPVTYPTITQTFPSGMNTVTFIATDCADNSSTCSFVVNVIDDEAPQIAGCPLSDMTISTSDCTPQEVTLPRPSNINDNCGVDGYSMTLTTGMDVPMVSFTEHPNIDGFVMDTVTMSFNMAAPPQATGTATIEVYFQGDADNFGNEETLAVIGEDGVALTGTTTPVVTSCGTSLELIGTYSVPYATLLAWLSDGTVDLTVAPVVNNLSGFGNDGDWNNDDFGINPCVAPGTFDGTQINVNDSGNTVLSVTVAFQNPVISYCVSGATSIASTEFPMDGTEPTILLNPGINTVSYKVADLAGNIDSVSCSAIYTVEEDMPLPTPVLMVDPDTEPDCPGDFVVIEDNSGYTGTNPVWTWYLDNPPLNTNAGEDMIIATTTTPSVFFQALPGTNYYYAVLSDNLCTSTASTSVPVMAGQEPTQPQIFASPNPVCSGDDFGLFIANSATEWQSYQWTGSNGYVFNGQFPPAITGVNNTSTTNNILTYILTVTSFTGCTAADTILVEIRPIPELPSLASNSPICNNEDIVLTTSATCDNYQWIGPNGASASTLASYASSTTVSTTTVPAGSDGYAGGMWTVICLSNNGCSSTSEPAEVIISNPISAAPSNDGPACVGDDIQLTVGSVTDAVSYSWSSTNGFSSSNQNPVLSNVTTDDADTYTVVVVDANGCSGTGSTTVSVSNIPAITAISVNPDANSCVAGDANITLNPSVDDGDGMPGDTGGPYTYNWTGENGFNSTNQMATLPNGSSADNGSYVLVVTNAAGCASEPFTVVVDVNDIPNTPAIELSETTLCAGDDLVLSTEGYVGSNVTYTWMNGTAVIDSTSVPSYTVNDVNINDSGDYSVMVSVDGCTSNPSQLIPVTVNPIPNTPSVFGESSICEGDILQLSTTFVAGAEYIWTGPNGFTASISNPTVFPVVAASAGGYAVQVIIDDCPSAFSLPLNVTVDEAPNAPTVTNNGPICIDDTGAVLTLSVTTGTATPGAMYEWFDAQTNNSLGSSGLSTNFNITDFSTYGDGVFEFYVVASNNDCISSPSVPTTVVLNAIPSLTASAGDDLVACDGSSVTLNADAPTTGIGTWTQINGPAVTIANPNAPNTSVTGMMSGSAYTFRWTLSNGACGDYSSDDVDVIVNSANQTAEAGNIVAACNAGTINLEAVPANTGNVGTWTQSATQAQLGIAIVNPNDPNSEVTGLITGNTYEFTWTLSNDACGDFSFDIVQVVVEDNMINASAGSDFIACGDGDAVIQAQPVASCSGMWTSPNSELVFADELSETTVVMDLQAGENMLVWTVNCGPCGISIDTLIITFESGATAVPDQATVSFNSTVEIDAIANDLLPTNYEVSLVSEPSNGMLTETSEGVWTYTHQSFDTESDQFTYQVCNTSCPDVCSEVTTVGISVEVSDECIVPTIITPNNDNINDAFIVQCLFASGKYPDNRVVIYNQWGDEVFSADNYENNWKGTYNGEDLPVGTYYYFVDLGDGSDPLTGFLIIER